MPRRTRESLQDGGQENEGFCLDTNLTYTDDINVLDDSANFETAIAIRPLWCL